MLLIGCPGEPEPARRDEVVLRVGERTMDVDRFVAILRTRSSASEFPLSGSGFEQLRARIVKELIVDEILLEEAARRGLESDPEALRAAREALVADHGDETSLREDLSERFGDPTVHEELVRRRLLLRRVEAELRRELRAGVEVTDEQVAAAEERFREQLRLPERMRTRQIFVNDEAVARSLRRRLVDGASFEELATEVNGADGDMGWTAADSAPDHLVAAVRDLQPGEISEVIRSPLGFHVFILVERRPAGMPEPEAAAARVRELLLDETVENRFRGWITARADELDVTVQEDRIAAVRCCRQGLPYVAEDPS